MMYQNKIAKAELAQLVERTTLNRVVEGSIPSFGVFFFVFLFATSAVHRNLSTWTSFIKLYALKAVTVE